MATRDGRLAGPLGRFMIFVFLVLFLCSIESFVSVAWIPCLIGLHLPLPGVPSKFHRRLFHSTVGVRFHMSGFLMESNRMSLPCMGLLVVQVGYLYEISVQAGRIYPRSGSNSFLTGRFSFQVFVILPKLDAYGTDAHLALTSQGDRGNRG